MIKKTKIISFAGWSGSGKTHLITRLIKFLTETYKLNISSIKHAHDSFDLDHKGKDTYLHKKAGAKEVIISSSKRWGIQHELKDTKELTIEELIKKASKVDLIFIEGWKFNNFKKIEVYNPKLKKPLLYKSDPLIMALVTNEPNIIKKDITVLDINNTQAIAKYLLNLPYDK